MKSLLEVASRPVPLCVTAFAAAVLLIAVFPALPIGGEMLDVKDGYTYPDVVAAMEEYGERGRQVYAWSSGILDTLFPGTYVSFLAGMLYRFRPTERLGILALVPVASDVADLGENVQIMLMLTRYPDISAEQVAIASMFTVLKGQGITISVALAALLAIYSGGCHLLRRVPT